MKKRSRKSMDVHPPKKKDVFEDVRLKTNTAYRPGQDHHDPSQHEQPEEPEEKKRRFGWKKRIALFLLFIFLITIVPLVYIGIWNWRNFSPAADKLFGTPNPLELVNTSPLETDNGRTNILLAGYSVDDPGHGGAELTDSILILSIDHSDQTGYMLSIPRDLYVEIPGYGTAKINEAYQAGERQDYRQVGYADGGMGLLEEVIEGDIGIELHYYVLLNYAAVRDVVDALGGVTVKIESDDERGLYDPSVDLATGKPLVELTNGKHKLDGQAALNLMRARGAGSGSYGYSLSDFTRTENQQKVLRALLNKLTWRQIADPRINKQIFDAGAENVETDIELSEVVPFYRLFSSVPSDKIKTNTLRDLGGENYLTGYTTPTGQSALIPTAGLNDFSEIQEAVSQLD